MACATRVHGHGGAASHEQDGTGMGCRNKGYTEANGVCAAGRTHSNGPGHGDGSP